MHIIREYQDAFKIVEIGTDYSETPSHYRARNVAFIDGFVTIKQPQDRVTLIPLQRITHLDYFDPIPDPGR